MVFLSGPGDSSVQPGLKTTATELKHMVIFLTHGNIFNVSGEIEEALVKMNNKQGEFEFGSVRIFSLFFLT